METHSDLVKEFIGMQKFHPG